MKTFYQWLIAEGLSDFLPNMGQRAIPINQTQTQTQTQSPRQPEIKQVSLSTLADQVQDLDWHSLYDIFDNYYRRAPQDPEVKNLGMALYNSAQTGNYALLRPFKEKHLQAQRFK